MKEANEYKQSGLNKKYPLEILTWRITDQVSPSWLIDTCRVSYIDEFGPHVQTRVLNSKTGSYELIGSDNKVLLSVSSRLDYICKDKSNNSIGSGIFVLTEKQLKLLYKLT